MTDVETIPKVLHYCWFGGNPLSELGQRCMLSWQEVMPDYSIVRWDEERLNATSPYVKTAYRLKKFAFVADYMRLWALHNEGGIYLDTDIEMVKPFDELLDKPLFLGKEAPSSVGVGVVGAVKGHPFLKLIMDRLDAEATANRISFEPLPVLVSHLLQSDEARGVAVLPEECFYPYNPYSPVVIRQKPLLSNMSEMTFCVHHWEGAWLGAMSLSMMVKLRLKSTINKAKTKVAILSYR